MITKDATSLTEIKNRIGQGKPVTRQLHSGDGFLWEGDPKRSKIIVDGTVM